jgi:hypothetical protein
VRIGELDHFSNNGSLTERKEIDFTAPLAPFQVPPAIPPHLRPCFPNPFFAPEPRPRSRLLEWLIGPDDYCRARQPPPATIQQADLAAGLEPDAFDGLDHLTFEGVFPRLTSISRTN